MKKVLALTVMSVLFAGVIATHAGADVPRTSRPTSAVLQATKITGTFTVPAPPTGELAGFACSNIYVSATSKDTLPSTGDMNLNPTPKWSRGVAATGTYSSGHCSYSIVVPANSAFYLNTGTSGTFACSYVSAWLGPTGAALGPITVPLSTTKTQNFAVTHVVCEFIN